MSSNTTSHRRQPPKTPTTHHHHPPTTIQNISNHFSRLYLNHKARTFSTPLISTPSSLTKSQSQTNTHDEEQQEEDSIKRAIVFSPKTPTNKKQENADLGPQNQERKSGYEVKMQSLSSIGMRRRSFGGTPQAAHELVDFFGCNGVKVVSTDMPPFMQIHAVDVTRKTYDSLEKFTAKTLALTLKKEFDGVYGAAWHCIVGFSFGSFVTHSVGGFLYFSMDHKLYVLLFKTSVQKAH